jgi:hypothetical protein
MLDSVLLELLHRLEAIGNSHEELFDSAVREAMDDVVTYGFLKPKSDFVLPTAFAMFSAEADQQIADAFAWFLPAADEAAKLDALDTFQKRLSAFQNLEVRTEQKNDYNDFFGWANPKDYDEAGNVCRDE